MLVNLILYGTFLTYICIKHYLFYKPTSKASKKEIAKLNKISHNEKRLQKELEEQSQIESELEEKINKLLKVYLYEFGISMQQDKLLDETIAKKKSRNRSSRCGNRVT